MNIMRDEKSSIISKSLLIRFLFLFALFRIFRNDLFSNDALPGSGGGGGGSG